MLASHRVSGENTENKEARRAPRLRFSEPKHWLSRHAACKASLGRVRKLPRPASGRKEFY
jgi:hypothetical protein